MTLEASSTALEVAKLILLPAIGFLAGFAAQWLLQARKSRDELLRALAEPRAAALCKLWELTTLPNEITRLTEDAEVPRRVLASLDSAIIDWYTKQAGALYLFLASDPDRVSPPGQSADNYVTQVPNRSGCFSPPISAQVRLWDLLGVRAAAQT